MLTIAEMRPRPRAAQQDDGLDAESCALSLVGLAIIVGFVVLLIFSQKWAREHKAKLDAAVAAQAQVRWEGLCRRFGRENATRILAGEIWQGQTHEMLVETLGPPADYTEKVMKTKTQHVLKWGHRGANRYAMRVTLDDGIVVGWEM